MQLHIYVSGMVSPFGPQLCYASAARQQARYLSRLYDAHLAPAGLTVSQYTILALLEAHGSYKIAELAHVLVMDRTSLVRALKPLQAGGWVVTYRPEKSRSLDVMLSPTGLAKVRQAAPLWAEAQAAYEDRIGSDLAVQQRDEILNLDLLR